MDAGIVPDRPFVILNRTTTMLGVGVCPTFRIGMQADSGVVVSGEREGLSAENDGAIEFTGFVM